VRAILDGHVVLSRQLAHQNHYPAIDVLQSVSRLTTQIMAPDLRAAGGEVRKLLAALRDKGDLISIGAYQRGTDVAVDTALDRRDAMERFLRQPVDHCSTLTEADEGLLSLVADLHAGEIQPAPVEEADAELPSVAPGPSALPPLNLPV
jgi:flagellum-specific ATP synthase